MADTPAARPVLLFDMDGVLVDYDPQVRVQHLATTLGRTAGAVKAAIYDSGIEQAGDEGRLDIDTYLAELGRELNCTVTADAWVAARRAATRARVDHLAVISEIAKEAEIAVLTNNGPLLAAEWPKIVPEFFPMFSGRAYTAAQFGVAKPDPLVYQRCLAAIGADPRRSLFVDDHAANVDGARQAGLSAHHYVNAQSFFLALRAFTGLPQPRLDDA